MGRKEGTMSVVALGLLLTLMGVFGTPPANGAEKAIKVGLVYDVSGPYAPISKINYDVLSPYIKYLNKMGGIAGHPVDLVFYDSASDPATAMTGTINPNRPISMARASDPLKKVVLPFNPAKALPLFPTADE